MRPRLLLLALLLLLASPVQGKKSLTLSAQITGLRSNKGHVRCLLFRSAKGFPKKPKAAVAAAQARPKARRARCLFQPPALGTYAISVIHDENDNQKLDTNFLGIPREGYGFSNNARGFMGPPSFKNASFRFRSTKQRVHIKLKY